MRPNKEDDARWGDSWDDIPGEPDWEQRLEAVGARSLRDPAPQPPSHRYSGEDIALLYRKAVEAGAIPSRAHILLKELQIEKELEEEAKKYGKRRVNSRKKSRRREDEPVSRRKRIPTIDVRKLPGYKEHYPDDSAYSDLLEEGLPRFRIDEEADGEEPLSDEDKDALEELVMAQFAEDWDAMFTVPDGEVIYKNPITGEVGLRGMTWLLVRVG